MSKFDNEGQIDLWALQEIIYVLYDPKSGLHTCGDDHRGGPAPCVKCMAESALSRLSKENIEREEKRRAVLEDLYEEAKRVKDKYFEAKEDFKDAPPMPFLWRRVHELDALAPTQKKI